MKHKRFICTFTAFILFISLFSWTTYAAPVSVTKRYIIKFKTKNVNSRNLVSKYNGKFRHDFTNLSAATADVNSRDLSSLENDPNIAFIEEDKIIKTADASLTNWGVSDIKAPSSWQSGLSGKGIKIAVIDTGIGPHSDLLVSGGTNVISGSATTSYADDNGHGTHVAGIIAGKGINNGVKGVAPDASLYAVKALNASGSGYTSDIISGINWAINNNINIINLSLGTSESDVLLQSAVDAAYNKGILVVASAGNSGNSSGTGTSIMYPANYASVIAVGAVDSNNVRAYFSSTGSKLEVSAPGVNVLSTYLNNSYVQMSGTSMAAPFAAGDLALLKQKYPSYTNAQLRQILDSSTIDLGAPNRDSLYGYGLIQAPTTSENTNVPNMPGANLPGGSYTGSQVVTLSDTTPGVSIYYTLDGTIPTKGSSLYKSPITISSSKTLKAIAINSNGTSSNVLSLSYNIVIPEIPAPIASISSGTYKGPLYIFLYSSYKFPLKAYYTLDGSTPTAKSTPYTGYIYINSSSILKVIAFDSSGNASKILTNTYNIVKPPEAPKASLKSGVYNKAQSITLSSATPKVTIYYTLDGKEPTAKSTKYSGPINISKNSILKAVAIDSSGNVSNKLISEYIILVKK